MEIRAARFSRYRITRADGDLRRHVRRGGRRDSRDGPPVPIALAGWILNDAEAHRVANYIKNSPCLCIVLDTQPVLAIIGAMINASLTGSWPSSGLPVRILAKA
jgi:hypothetical protein